MHWQDGPHGSTTYTGRPQQQAVYAISHGVPAVPGELRTPQHRCCSHTVAIEPLQVAPGCRLQDNVRLDVRRVTGAEPETTPETPVSFHQAQVSPPFPSLLLAHTCC